MEIGPATATPEEVEVSSSSSAADEPSSAGSSPGASSCGSNDNIPGDNSNRMSKYELLDEDEEEDVCRICRNPGDVENPLRYPCACSGSIKFVHQDCLLQWLNHSNARQCEVCKHPFSFSPVYADNAPARLPFQEFIIGIAMKACHVLQFFITLDIYENLEDRMLTEKMKEIEMELVLQEDKVAQANRNIVVDGNGEDGGAPGVVVAGQMIRRNAENVAARWEMQAARLEAHVEQMFDGLDDADGAEDVPFDELVGMQGPVFHLVENAFTVLASNMIFLGVIIFVPFSLGRVLLYYLSWLLSSATSPVLSAVVPLTESALSLANITLKNALTAVVNLTSDNHENLKVNTTAQTEVLSNISSTIAADLLKVQSAGTSRLSDATTLAVGYMFIFSLVIFYLGIITLIRYSRGEPLTMGRFYGVASIAETIPSLFRQFVAAMRHLMTMIKVAFLLVIELGVFPLMCGWWLDVCTIRMFGKSISQRVEFFSVSPLASSLVHWIVGIVYMLQISIFVSLLRGVLRNGVLYFLRDPADPNYNPFRDLIDDPVHKHARRVLLSVAVYGSLIVMLVYLPVKLAIRMAPSIFPLDISISDPFTEIPADMLLFQICIPFAIEHFKLRHTLKSLLRYWFTAVGWTLGLTDFLLPKPEEENANGDPGRQDRGHAQAGGREQALALEDVNRPRYVPEDTNSGEEFDGDEPADSDRWAFVLRIVLLLVMAWMTLLVFNSALIVVPISLGRGLFSSMPLLPITHGIKCNDLYAFVIGSYVVWTASAGARYCAEFVRTRRTRLLLHQIWKWFGIIVKSFCSFASYDSVDSCILLIFQIFVIPVLIGLLFELLVIVPMRVPVDESPVFLLYQDWALGLIFLKIWTRLVMLDHMMPLVDESWRIKFERLHNYGENLARQADSSVALENQGSIGNDTDVNQNIQEAADVGLRQRNVLRQDA
ncbi:UNVERIFIED_CONTAM: putative E3 ubiquitin ligase SUD1 [Sesamum angustifolium]|uniref:RING-type E3 ubiquitin transferase n=1 Tax=Sesamum angustifolium TaxID=2727405 RepID=A0AAW2NXQ6_9LAMI